MKKFDELVPGDKIIYKNGRNAPLEIGVFVRYKNLASFNTRAFFKWENGVVLHIGESTYIDNVQDTISVGTPEITKGIIELVLTEFSKLNSEDRIVGADAIEAVFKAITYKHDPEYAEYVRLTHKFKGR